VKIVPVSLLNEPRWCSILSKYIKVLRLTQRVRQSQNSAFAALLMDIAEEIFPQSEPLPLKSTSNYTTAYRFIWPCVSTGNSQDVDLDIILICARHSLVNEHNETALRIFPGPLPILRSATRIDKARGSNTEHDIIQSEFTYKYAPTGIPSHELQLKKGVPILVIRNVLHPYLLNEATFVVKHVTRKLVYISTILKPVKSPQAFMLHRLDF